MEASYERLMSFKVKEISETSSSVVVEEELWLAADHQTVVPAGDSEAAYLLATAGKRMSRADAEKYGLVKSSAKSGDKQRKPSENK